MKIKTDDYWKPQLRVLLLFFFYLIEPRFHYIIAVYEVNLTRRCFHDVNRNSAVSVEMCMCRAFRWLNYLRSSGFTLTVSLILLSLFSNLSCKIATF